jgi:hypothetical protein
MNVLQRLVRVILRLLFLVLRLVGKFVVVVVFMVEVQKLT